MIGAMSMLFPRARRWRLRRSMPPHRTRRADWV